MSKLSIAALAVAGVSLAACGGGTNMFQTQASSPTVTYSYSDGGDYDEVAKRAQDYCDDEYRRSAVLLSRDQQGDRYEATFTCH